MKVLGLVPARAGSKGILHKNIRGLGGRPLMAYAIENVRSVLGKCFVSTDSEEYAEIAESYGAIVLERPDGLADDRTRLVEVAAYHGKGYDGVLMQPPTAPFVTENTLLRLLSGVHRGHSAVTVHPSREYGTIEGHTVYPRQRREPKWVLNGCASFRGADVLQECDLKSNALWNPHYVEIHYPEALNIDDAWDWQLAEWIAGSSARSESTTITSPVSSMNISSSSERAS